MDIREAKRLDDLERECKARGEILDAITKHCGEGNSWLSCAELDWRQKMRDFANDSDNHSISKKEWKVFHDSGKVTLFLSGNYATAYFDDAATIWDQSDDDYPMYHVMVQSDPPHRTVIHLIFLVNWIVKLAEMCIPVQIVDMQFVESAQELVNE